MTGNKKKREEKAHCINSSIHFPNTPHPLTRPVDIYSPPWDFFPTELGVPYPFLRHFAVRKAPLADIQCLYHDPLPIPSQRLLADDLLWVPARVPALKHHIAEYHIVDIAL